MNQSTPWARLQARLSEIETLNQIGSVLHWDQQVTMPAGGAKARATQSAFITAERHKRMTAPELSALVEEIAQAPQDDVQRASVRNLRRQLRRANAMPASLVRELSVARSEAFPAWAQAKQDKAFQAFVPYLGRLIELSRQEIACLQQDGQDPYDVLLEPYDPGTTVAQLDPMFERLGGELSAFLEQLSGRPHPVEPLTGPFPIAGQKALHAALVPTLGYEMTRGRLDEAEHPFTIDMGPGDTRITTHYYEDDLLSGLGGTIHETGHGLYEQGLPEALSATGAGGAAGMGLHESQSRFWENVIGRSLPFCEWLAPQVSAHVGVPMDGRTLYAANNRVEPGFIRIFADEVTYNLHIVVRYQLERQIFSGQLDVQDLDQAWADAMQDKLGIRPGSPDKGVLQDIHWAQAYFGYFPSYTLGNLYAASLARAMEAALPDMWEQVGRGEFGAILGWLRTHVHHKAHLQDAPEIMAAACGEQDHVANFMAHVRGRHGALYGV
ncbi:MAG: carboxypeptidase M32 [Myxococcota bacterium]|nr:carboxypeptidase M32 [Myxococcota bacterium]